MEASPRKVNQCCYGHENERSWKRGTFKLILSGTGAGTPDLGVGKYEHAVADVVPVHECGVEEYLHLRPPFVGGNRGVGCKSGLSSPMMLSEAEVVEEPFHAFRSRVNCYPFLQILKKRLQQE